MSHIISLGWGIGFGRRGVHRAITVPDLIVLTREIVPCLCMTVMKSRCARRHLVIHASKPNGGSIEICNSMTSVTLAEIDEDGMEIDQERAGVGLTRSACA